MAKSNKAIKGSVFIVASKWLQRILGIISFFVLARILGADDFGIVAMSFIILGFFRSITETGTKQYILSKIEVSLDNVHTAWTINFLAQLLVSAFMVVFASFFAGLFNEPRLEAVLYVASAVPVINGLQSAGQLYLQREFKYGAISISQVVAKIISFGVTLFVAFKYETYWALIIGDLIFCSIFTLATYFIHPYRPKFSFFGLGLQWAFSKWMLLKSIVGYLRSKADQFLVSIYYSTHDVGMFNVAKELSLMPYSQISEPLGPVFISSITNNKHDSSLLKKTYLQIFISIFMIMLPVTVGFFLLKDELVALILGEKWVGVEVLVGFLAPLILATSLSSLTASTLTSLQKVKAVFYLDLTGAIIVILVQYLVKDLPLEEFAGVRSILGWVVLISFLAVVKYYIKISFLRLIIGLIPSTIGVVVMGGFVLYVLQGIYEYSDISRLIIGVLAGVISYIIATYLSLLAFSKVNEDSKDILDKVMVISNKLIKSLKVK